MPQTKAYTAKQTLLLDCGHLIKQGDSFVVSTIYTCQQEHAWPLTILMACLRLARRKRLANRTSPPVTATKP